MFYSYDLLCRRKGGRYSIIWHAATHKSVAVTEARKVDIANICQELIDSIVQSENVPRQNRLSLYLSSMLMYGLCLVFRKQVILWQNDAISFNEKLFHKSSAKIASVIQQLDSHDDVDGAEEGEEGPRGKGKGKGKGKRPILPPPETTVGPAPDTVVTPLPLPPPVVLEPLPETDPEVTAGLVVRPDASDEQQRAAGELPDDSVLHFGIAHPSILEEDARAALMEVDPAALAPEQPLVACSLQVPEPMEVAVEVTMPQGEVLGELVPQVGEIPIDMGVATEVAAPPIEELAGLAPEVSAAIRPPPEMEQELQPPAEARVLSEVQPEAQPEAQLEVQPEVQPEAQPEVQLEAQPEAQPEVQPEAQPEARPEVAPAPVPPLSEQMEKPEGEKRRKRRREEPEEEEAASGAPARRHTMMIDRITQYSFEDLKKLVYVKRRVENEIVEPYPPRSKPDILTRFGNLSESLIEGRMYIQPISDDEAENELEELDCFREESFQRIRREASPSMLSTERSRMELAGIPEHEAELQEAQQPVLQGIEREPPLPPLPEETAVAVANLAEPPLPLVVEPLLPPEDIPAVGVPEGASEQPVVPLPPEDPVLEQPVEEPVLVQLAEEPVQAQPAEELVDQAAQKTLPMPKQLDLQGRICVRSPASDQNSQEPPPFSSSPGTRWKTTEMDLLKKLGELWLESGETTFCALCPRATTTRYQAALTMSILLQLAKDRRLTLNQSEPYGTITIREYADPME